MSRPLRCPPRVDARHSVWGILQGPSTGKVLAELIMEGEARSVDLTDLSPGMARMAAFLGAVHGHDDGNLDLYLAAFQEYLAQYKAVYGVQGAAAQEGSVTRSTSKDEL